MAADYYSTKDALRREGQNEAGARFREMAGGAGPGTPSYAESREPIVDATVTPAPAKSLKAGFYQGVGGYEYIVGPQGEVTIANSPNARGIGTVVDVDSPFYDFIATELAGKQDKVSSIPAPVAQRLAQAKAPKKAGPKATVTPGGVEGMEIEPPMTQPAPAPKVAPQTAAPQATAASPPPARRDPASEFGTRANIRATVGGAVENFLADEERRMAFSQRTASARADAVAALVKNGMDASDARRFVNTAIEREGEKALPMLEALGGARFTK
jgi:hypothetical protein